MDRCREIAASPFRSRCHRRFLPVTTAKESVVARIGDVRHFVHRATIARSNRMLTLPCDHVRTGQPPAMVVGLRFPTRPRHPGKLWADQTIGSHKLRQLGPRFGRIITAKICDRMAASQLNRYSVGYLIFSIGRCGVDRLPARRIHLDRNHIGKRRICIPTRTISLKAAQRDQGGSVSDGGDNSANCSLPIAVASRSPMM